MNGSILACRLICRISSYLIQKKSNWKSPSPCLHSGAALCDHVIWQPALVSPALCLCGAVNIGQIVDMQMLLCVSSPAVLGDVFFRVDASVRLSGSPSRPQKMIERWVRRSHSCLSAPPSLDTDVKRKWCGTFKRWPDSCRWTTPWLWWISLQKVKLAGELDGIIPLNLWRMLRLT